MTPQLAPGEVQAPSKEELFHSLCQIDVSQMSPDLRVQISKNIENSSNWERIRIQNLIQDIRANQTPKVLISQLNPVQEGNIYAM